MPHAILTHLQHLDKCATITKSDMTQAKEVIQQPRNYGYFFQGRKTTAYEVLDSSF